MSATLLVTSADGTERRRLPSGCILPFDGTIERYGGYGDFSVPTTLDYLNGAPDVQLGDRVEYWQDGVRQYRGYVSARTRSADDPRKLTLSCYGRAMQLRKVVCAKNYAFPNGPLDVGSAFAELANDLVNRTPWPSNASPLRVASPDAIGPVSMGIQARNMLFGDVIDNLVTSAANLCTWGVDVDENGDDRLYLRKVKAASPPIWTIPVPSRIVERAEGEEQAGDLVNVAIVKGGNPIFPQLLHNGDFALPIYQSDQTGNLLLDGDFELDTIPLYWSLNDGASVSEGKSTNYSYASPYAGKFFVELDNIGENVRQIRDAALVEGHTYNLVLYSAKEIADQDLAGTATLNLYDGSGGTGTLLKSVALNVAPTLGQKWDKKLATFVAPPGVVSYDLKVNCDSITGLHGEGGGLVIDNVQLYDASVVYQDGWDATPVGSPGAVNFADWTHDGSPVGGTCVLIDATSSDSDGHDLKLEPKPGNRFKAAGGQDFTFGIFLKVPDGSATPKFFLELRWYDGSGGFVGGGDRSPDYDGSDFTGANIDGWYYFEFTHAAPSGTSTGMANVTWRSDGALMAALASVRDFQAPTMGLDGGTLHPERYQADGNVLFVIRSDDAGLASWLGATPAYADSIATYGLCGGNVQDTNIQDIFGAYAAADNLFNASAFPVTRPPITLLGDSRPYWPGDTVSLQGTDGPQIAPDPLPIARIRFNYDGILHKTLELEREVPDENIVTQRLILDQIRKYGGGNTSSGTSGYSSSSSGSSGATVAPPAATESVLGTVKMSAAPGDAASPVAVGDNDPRVGAATTAQLGIVSPDGSTITATAGVLSVSEIEIDQVTGLEDALTAVAPGATVTASTSGSIAAGVAAVIYTGAGAVTFDLPPITAATRPLAIINPAGGTTVNAGGGDQVDGGSSASFVADCYLFPVYDIGGGSFWRSLHVA
jgi:hypothetical protein